MAVSHTGWEDDVARMLCRTKKGQPPGGSHAREGKERYPAPGPDLQRVHPLEAGIFHRQEEGVVLRRDSAV